MSERRTGKLSHGDCHCPCHFQRDIITPDNCSCGYDGRDESRPRTAYVGTQDTAPVSCHATVQSHVKVAAVWVDANYHLHIKLSMNNVSDVIFEGSGAVMPRSIRFER